MNVDEIIIKNNLLEEEQQKTKDELIKTTKHLTPFNISNADFHSIKKILKNVKSTGVLTLTRLFLNADCLT